MKKFRYLIPDSVDIPVFLVLKPVQLTLWGFLTGIWPGSTVKGSSHRIRKLKNRLCWNPLLSLFVYSRRHLGELPPLSLEGEAVQGEHPLDPSFFLDIFQPYQELSQQGGCPGGGAEAWKTGAPRSDCLFLWGFQQSLKTTNKRSQEQPLSGYQNNKIIINTIHFHSGKENMAEFQIPTCDNNHDMATMTRVWADGRGNAVYQCPVCGRKMQGLDGANRR